MRFYRYLCTFILLTSNLAIANEALKEEDKKIEKKITLTSEQQKLAESIVNEVEETKYKSEHTLEIINESGKATKNNRIIAKKVIKTQSHAENNTENITTDNQIMDAIDFGINSGITQPQSKEEVGRYGDIDIYIMISYSMPNTSIERLYSEAIHQHPNKNIIFLLRGWNAPDLQSLMAKVNKSIEDFETPPDIAIDPTFFRKLNVTEVPFFAVKNKEEKWKKVTGDISINQAINEANNHYENKLNRGRTYLIEEPDILSYIEKKIENYDFEADIAKAKEKIVSDKFQEHLPEATKDESYLVDPAVTFKKPMYYKNEVIVSPGQQINPLKFIALSKKYIVIDTTSEKQIEVARQWKSEFNNVVVISNNMPDNEAHYKKLNIEFGKVQELDPLITRRFKLKHVPSLIEQEGDLLRVTVVGTKKPKESTEEEL